jgi:hypothetical protein
VKQDRLSRERRTIRCMIEINCRRRHRTKEGLCAECQPLLDYAIQRIDKCPYRDEKPTCAQCSIHCYKPDLRLQMRQVMKETGPWMMLYHPVLTFLHMRDGTIRARKLKSNARKNGR